MHSPTVSSPVWRLGAWAALALSAGTVAQAATPLFSQGPSGATMMETSSMLWPDGSDIDSQVWDNFILGQAATAESLSWWGSAPTNVSEFAISFYTDISAIPYNITHFGYQLSSALQPDIGAGAMQSFTVQLADLQTSTDASGATRYTAALNRPLALDGQRSYWVTVQAHESPSNSWGWLTTAGDHKGFGKGGTFGGGDYRFYMNSYDVAFQVSGTPSVVPEPASLWLAFSGLAALGAGAWRRHSRSA